MSFQQGFFAAGFFGVHVVTTHNDVKMLQLEPRILHVSDTFKFSGEFVRLPALSQTARMNRGSEMYRNSSTPWLPLTQPIEGRNKKGVLSFTLEHVKQKDEWQKVISLSMFFFPCPFYRIRPDFLEQTRQNLLGTTQSQRLLGQTGDPCNIP